MANAPMTVSVQFWPVRTRDEIDAAGWELFDDVPGVTAHTMRSYGSGVEPDIYLQLNVKDLGVVAEPRLGMVLVKSEAGWESITPEAAESRGLPLPPLPES